MSRQLFSKLLAFWSRRSPRRSASGGPTWPEGYLRLSMGAPGAVPSPFTPDQLDDLYRMLSPGLDTTRGDRPSRGSRGRDGSDRQAPFLQVVDRAIAELGSPRGRKRRARW